MLSLFLVGFGFKLLGYVVTALAGVAAGYAFRGAENKIIHEAGQFEQSVKGAIGKKL